LDWEKDIWKKIVTEHGKRWNILEKAWLNMEKCGKYGIFRVGHGKVWKIHEHPGSRNAAISL